MLLGFGFMSARGQRLHRIDQLLDDALQSGEFLPHFHNRRF